MTGMGADAREFRTRRLIPGLSFVVFLFFAPVGDPGKIAATGASASELMARLRVAAEQAGSSYDRDLFKHWTDVDNDCQDARAEVLARDSKSPVTRSCRVTVGRWLSWYDGVEVTQASKIDIDHMVPLNEAWESGAWSWTPSQREAYANDLGFIGSLTAVSYSSNRSKGSSDPAEWLPRYEQCRYAQDWVAVKYRWQLSIDRPEKQALENLLAGNCGKKTILVSQVSLPKTGTSPSTTAPATPGTSGTTDPRFATCTKAKAQGYGPYIKGVDPAYEWYRDADRDGRVCE